MSDDDTPRIRFKGVDKAFGDTVVLDDFDLDVGRSEKLAVLGPSGSGKSTILRHLMTLEPIDGGVIEIDGEPLWHEPDGNGGLKPAGEAHLRKMRNAASMVFQQFNLFPHMSVLDNCTLAPRKVLGRDDDAAREQALELLDMVGLKHKADAYPGQLSGGQQQRVAIARGLAMEPRIMLFDEITSALDPETVGDIRAVMEDIAAERPLTMVIVTHELSFARALADRVVFLWKGRIEEDAPPKQFFENPSSERLQQFLERILEG